MAKFFLTTAIDYVNDVIHVGHAYQKVVADVIARFHRLLGEEVFFLTGVDEHGGKAEEAAKAAGQPVDEFVDQIVKANKDQLKVLNVSPDRYIRTTDQDHVDQVIDFYQKVKANGDIYSAKFTGFYCLGCEEYKTETDLVDGHCPHHPNLAIKKLSEDNYFFAWSKYQDFLKDYINHHPDFIKPASRRQEMLAFLDQGLKDISISRASVSWGIPVPDDPTQTIYVWFDALINYLTGAPAGFWPADLHLLGKDNTRWHALLWPAMLKSAGYPLPKTIYSHGFLTLNGQKISKSLGNIIRPTDLTAEFGSDGARYLLLTAKTVAGDGDISWSKMREKYNADLANGLGNLVARLARLAQLSDQEMDISLPTVKDIPDVFSQKITNFQFISALDFIWEKIRLLDQELNQTKPWQIKDKQVLAQSLVKPIETMLLIGLMLTPFLPQTASTINSVFSSQKITPPKPLFTRK